MIICLNRFGLIMQQHKKDTEKIYLPLSTQAADLFYARSGDDVSETLCFCSILKQKKPVIQ